MNVLTRIVDAIRGNPVRTVAVIRSAILVALAFWPGLLTSDQSAAILTFAALFLGADEVVRSQVTPTK